MTPETQKRSAALQGALKAMGLMALNQRKPVWDAIIAADRSDSGDTHFFTAAQAIGELLAPTPPPPLRHLGDTITFDNQEYRLSDPREER